MLVSPDASSVCHCYTTFKESTARTCLQAGPEPAAGKPKRWWETDKGKQNIKAAAGEGRRAADNTYVIEREQDDFERLGLLGDTPRECAPLSHLSFFTFPPH